MPKNRTRYAGQYSRSIARWAAGSWSRFIKSVSIKLLHYMKMTGIKLGMLANFGSYPQAEVERRVL